MKLRLVFACISIFQILGLSIAVIVAAVDIESIIVSGPILSITGLVAALSWRFCRSVFLGALGLSAPAMSLFLLLLISGLNWSPSDAQVPVTAILIGYEVLIAPFALVGLYMALTRSAGGEDHAPFQFSLQSLVLASIFVGTVYAGIEVLTLVGYQVQLAMSIGLAVAILIAVIVVFACGVRKRVAAMHPNSPSVPAHTHRRSQ